MKFHYEFKTDTDAREFCDTIVAEMIRLFNISADEAVGRINRHWRGQDFQRIGEDLRFHEFPEFWANDIFYGSTSRWWKNPPGLKPKPYP